MTDSEKDPTDKVAQIKARASSNWFIAGLMVSAAVVVALNSAFDFFSHIRDAASSVRSGFKPSPFTVHGAMRIAGAPDLPTGSPTVRVFWARPSPGVSKKERLDDVIQSPEYARLDAGSGILSYELTLRTEPPPEAIQTMRSESGAIEAKIAHGVLVAFLDIGRDGLFNEGSDKLLATELDAFIVWREVHRKTEMQLSKREESEYSRAIKLSTGYCLAKTYLSSDAWPGEVGWTCEDKGKDLVVDFTVNSQRLTELDAFVRRNIADRLALGKDHP